MILGICNNHKVQVLTDENRRLAERLDTSQEGWTMGSHLGPSGQAAQRRQSLARLNVPEGDPGRLFSALPEAGHCVGVLSCDTGSLCQSHVPCVGLTRECEPRDGDGDRRALPPCHSRRGQPVA